LAASQWSCVVRAGGQEVAVSTLPELVDVLVYRALQRWAAAIA
jgi:hypothetical protein